MGLYWQLSKQPPRDPYAAAIRRVRLGLASRLRILFVLACFAVAVPGAKAFSFTQDHLENVVKLSDAKPKKQTHQGILPATLVCLIGVAILLVTIRKLHERADLPSDADALDPLEHLHEEEPALAAMWEHMRPGEVTPALPLLGTALGKGGAVAKFFQTAPAEIARMEKLVMEVKRSSDAGMNQAKLKELASRFRYLNYGSGLSELRAFWQLSFTLEGLVNQLANKESNVTSSGLQTVAGALDLMRVLCLELPKLQPVAEKEVKLLAVDDDEVTRFAVSAALKKAFNQPDLAPEGATALTMAEQKAYDIIFLDVEMPGMNGFELCEKILKTELNRSTPVVFVTRHSDFDARAKAALSGGRHLIGKPFLAMEIAVKGLTLVMQSRLKSSLAGQKVAQTDPAPASSSKQPNPKKSPVPATGAGSVSQNPGAPETTSVEPPLSMAKSTA